MADRYGLLAVKSNKQLNDEQDEKDAMNRVPDAVESQLASHIQKAWEINRWAKEEIEDENGDLQKFQFFSFEDNELENGETYHYSVSAIDKADNYSSSVVTAETIVGVEVEPYAREDAAIVEYENYCLSV